MPKSILIAWSLSDVLHVLIINCIQVTVLPSVTMSCTECAACFLILWKQTAIHWSHMLRETKTRCSDADTKVLHHTFCSMCQRWGRQFSLPAQVFVPLTLILRGCLNFEACWSFWNFCEYVRNKSHGLCSAGYLYSLDLDNRNSVLFIRFYFQHPFLWSAEV